VYIDEAHPTDGWKLSVNKQEGACFMRPKTLEQRMKLARVSMEQFGMSSVPVLVDLMDNNANSAFAGWPERLYVLRENKVAFKGGPGPFGYDIDALEKWMTHNVN